MIPPADQEQIASALEDNAEFVSTTQLETLLADQPDEIQQEIIEINSDAGDRALQMAMLVPILACLLGFINAFRHDAPPRHRAVGRRRGTALGLSTQQSDRRAA